MGAIEAINIISCNTINFRKEHRAGDRLTCAAASPLSEFKQWVAAHREGKLKQQSQHAGRNVAKQRVPVGGSGGHAAAFPKSMFCQCKTKTIKQNVQTVCVYAESFEALPAAAFKTFDYSRLTMATLEPVGFSVSNLLGQPLA